MVYKKNSIFVGIKLFIMNKIEYDVALNDEGRPCIELSPEYEDKPEDKFFAIEISRYVLQDVYNRRSAEFDEKTSTKLEECMNLLGQIGDEIAVLLWENMRTMGDMDMIFNKKYHAQVSSIEELNEITEYIHSDGKIYKIQDGIKVLVIDTMIIYEQKDKNWTEVS